MAHWKHTATRCAVGGCERTRMKGHTTCGLYGHAERGVSLYGLKPGEPKLNGYRQGCGTCGEPRCGGACDV